MTGLNRLSLSEYSNKYDVSVSTLRRRIRMGLVDFILEDGKYFLRDASLIDQKNCLNQTQATSDPMSLAPPQLKKGHRSAIPKAALSDPCLKDATFIEASDQHPHQSDQALRDQSEKDQADVTEDSMFSTAKEILGELKKAYVQILQEKEEQILVLKEEVTDLHMLVRILEEENTRLKKEKSQPPISDWLDSLGPGEN